MSNAIIVVSTEIKRISYPITQGRFGIRIVATVNQNEHMKEYTPVGQVGHGKVAAERDQYSDPDKARSDFQKPV